MTEWNWITVVLSVVAMLVSVSGAFREWVFGRPNALAKYEEVVNSLQQRVDKLEAENRRLETENAISRKRIDDLEAENRRLAVESLRNHDRIRELDGELDRYRLGVVVLISQMQEANITPKWQPPARRNTGELRGKT